jgi:hypothetical protein
MTSDTRTSRERDGQGGEEEDELRATLAQRERELAGLREQLEEERRQGARLREQLAAAEQQGRRLAEQNALRERQEWHLANLCAAAHRLREALDRQDVLLGIQEIVSAIIGSEQLALFELTPDGSALSLVLASGVEAAPLQRVLPGEGRIGKAVLTGQTYIAEQEDVPAAPREAGLTACVPLLLADRPYGVLAIFELLPQKQSLDATDRELFEMLSRQAATALYCALPPARTQA